MRLFIGFAVLLLAAAAASSDPMRDAERNHRPVARHMSRPHMVPINLEPQDKVVVLSGPLEGAEARVVALQHKFFDAEVWAELLTLQADPHGHVYWLMIPVCALEKVE